MSNFNSRFVELTSDARRVFLAQGSAIREHIPRLFSSDFERLLRSISDLLEKVDKGKVDHPEYLAHSSGHIGEYAISLLTNFEASFGSGPGHFVQTTLPGLLLCEERLVKGVGNYYYNVKDVKDRYVRELQKLAEESLGFFAKAKDARDKVNEVQSAYKDATDEIALSLQTAKAAEAEIGTIRERASKLASGDGRGKSLEALKRRAESKLEAIEDVLAKASTARVAADQSVDEVEKSQQTMHEYVKKLADVEHKANEILALSNQAGLASSYLSESKKLGRKSFYFTIILYLAAFATLALAGFYVIPGLEQTVGPKAELITENALLATLLRATILAPLVYVIYFTTRQISSLETLRMDYAEKAAASLAYSGYKDEMTVDGDLLDQLRGSLLLRFAKHPERLLRKKPAKESIHIRAPGFLASSRSDDRRAQWEEKGGEEIHDA